MDTWIHGSSIVVSRVDHGLETSRAYGPSRDHVDDDVQHQAAYAPTAPLYGACRVHVESSAVQSDVLGPWSAPYPRMHASR